MGFFGGIANKIQILLFKFSDKFDIQNDGHYIQTPPLKLSILDRFLLKHYFKTKPFWEYTEEERQKIAARYRK
jgi:hypothetical protein